MIVKILRLSSFRYRVDDPYVVMYSANIIIISLNIMNFLFIIIYASFLLRSVHSLKNPCVANKLYRREDLFLLAQTSETNSAQNMRHEQGFGCMGFSAFYASARKTSEESDVSVFHNAVESGVTLFNTATFYGALNIDGFGSNIRLIKQCLVGIDRSKIQLMVKIGMNTKAPVNATGTVWNNRADKEGLKADVDYALEQLGVDYIDIIVLCRVSPTIAIEESVQAMADIVKEGKANHIALSEASPASIRRANAVAPIYCIEQEWSLWSRDIEKEIVPLCRQLGIKIVAYSPLGRGFLTGTIRNREADCLDPSDFRLNGMPRFSEENMATNLQLVDAINHIAARKNCTVGQLSLAWLTAQGPDVIPIPGTTSILHLEENLAARDIELSEEDMIEINNVFDPEKVAGDRYAHMAMTYHGNT